jgi:hypothetical protein
MKHKVLLGAVCAALVCGLGTAADVKSGPEPGKSVPVFHPFNVTGTYAGKTQCLV